VTTAFDTSGRIVMTNEPGFEEKVVQLKQKVRSFGDDAEAQVIEETAQRLEKLNYAPPVIISIDKFLRLTKDSLLEEIDRILALPDAEACALAPDDPRKCQDLRLQFISVQIFYFEKLLLLRQGDIETWEEIDELYVHD
jgi:hypothetical protein